MLFGKKNFWLSASQNGSLHQRSGDLYLPFISVAWKGFG
jgi:hypothetical protein